MKRLLHSIAAVLLASGAVFGQANHFCATDHFHRELVNQDPQLAKDIQDLIRNGMSKSDYDSTTIYTIPVVFHVLHQNGPENISDEQIIDCINVMNRDYAGNDPNAVNVIPAFADLIGTANIRFKLATIDPQGNCTNGIDRIFTHETENGADHTCKINQWDRSKYMNIWVVKNMKSGVAGYAMFPSDVQGYGYWMDGIVVRYNSVGTIGTSSPSNAFTLTHEVGHWLSLPHVWGFNNDAGVICGDDGINDTPVTKGYNLWCPTPEQSKICNPEVYENYQNYMDYSYCSFMFTPGQVKTMRTTLTSNTSLRNNLITEENGLATGVALTEAPVCVPKPDYKVSKSYACVGDAVTFTEQATLGPVTYREWTFEDGTPSTSTSAVQNVVFSTPGRKTITLKVGNASGENTETFTQIIDVQPKSAYNTVKTYNFENDQDFYELFLNNIGDNYGKFNLTNKGKEGRGLKLQLYKDLTGVMPVTEESRYYQNLGGQQDEIVTPTFDLRYMTGVTFSFDFSYASNFEDVTDIKEKMQVFYSDNCGTSWSPMVTNGLVQITGANIVSAGFAGNIDFEPSNETDWKNLSYNFNSNNDKSAVRFKIVFTASDISSNLFIDNIMINGVLGLEDDFENTHNLVIAPNPVVSGGDLTIQYEASNEPVTFTLRNLQGAEVASVTRTEVNQPVSFGFAIPNVAASYYLLEVKSASGVSVKKVAVIK